MCGTDCFLMLLSVLFPPIGVWVKRGICSADSLINLALSCLGFLPGLLHSWYIILQYPDPYEYDRVPDGERADNVTYYYVARGPAPPRQAGQGQQANYGTVGSQPSSGQFPGQQQSGVVNSFTQAQQPKPTVQPQYVPAGQGGESSAGHPSAPPPTYADAIKGDNKVQK